MPDAKPQGRIVRPRKRDRVIRYPERSFAANAGNGTAGGDDAPCADGAQATAPEGRPDEWRLFARSPFEVGHTDRRPGPSGLVECIGKPTVLLAGDQAIALAGLFRVPGQDFEVVGTVGDGEALVSAVQALNPDIIVTNIAKPAVKGIEAVRRIRKADSGVKIVLLSTHPDLVSVIEALTAGGSAYVLKGSAQTELVTAMREALMGRVYVTPSIVKAVKHEPAAQDPDPDGEASRLTARQQEVLGSIARGDTTKETAAALKISTRTVEFHKYHLMRQLGVHSVAELTRLAIKLGILTP